jgi:uncharacterized RDD family membrane protein YckC
MQKKQQEKKRVLVMDAAPVERLLAFILDMILIKFTIFLPFEKSFASAYAAAGLRNSSFNESYAFFSENPQVAQGISNALFLLSLLVVLYFAILENKLGQTPGKMVMGIAVMSEIGWKENSMKISRASFMQCFLRNIIFFPFLPFIIIWIIDPFLILFRKDHKKITEILTKTRTLRYQEY